MFSLAPAPCGSCMVFFKPGLLFSPATAHIIFPPVTAAGAGLLPPHASHLPEPWSAVSLPSRCLPFSHARLCPFCTHLLAEGMCWPPMVMESCLLKNRWWFLKVAIRALPQVQRSWPCGPPSAMPPARAEQPLAQPCDGPAAEWKRGNVFFFPLCIQWEEEL